MVYLGADHGGYQLKEKIKIWLQRQNIQFEDCGATTLDPDDDYPDFAVAVARKVAQDPESKGILLCRSGAGMVIAANKVSSIRAVEVFDERSARHAREHNDANVASLSADWLDESTVFATLSTFLSTPFPNEERHVRRIKKISIQEPLRDSLG